MFSPRVAMASLSGTSDAMWARTGLPYVGTAFVGGIAICDRTRDAARRMRSRGREEFIPADPYEFISDELRRVDATTLRPAVNVRTVNPAALRRVAGICARRGGILELNAHCRQAEMCAVGAGEILLADTSRLATYVEEAADAGAAVSVKVRAEVPGVDLVETARAIESAGGAAIHVDAMDTEASVGRVARATELFVIANNGIRDGPSARQYLEFGADALSVGRASDEPATLRRVADVVTDERGRSATIDRKQSPG